MELLDNINRLLGDDLKQTLKSGARLKIAASCFSMYAFDALKDELERVEERQFIFTSPTFVPDEVSDSALAACFDAEGGVDEAFVKELARLQPLRSVFRDAGFRDSAMKISIEQIFRQLSPGTEVKCL